MAAVSLVTPSPAAPNSRTLKVSFEVLGEAGCGVCAALRFIRGAASRLHPAVFKKRRRARSRWTMSRWYHCERCEGVEWGPYETSGTGTGGGPGGEDPAGEFRSGRHVRVRERLGVGTTREEPQRVVCLAISAVRRSAALAAGGVAGD